MAASHPVMWRDILLSNRESVLELLEDWAREVEAIRSAVKDRDARAIEAFFRKAKESREGLPEGRKGGSSRYTNALWMSLTFPGRLPGWLNSWGRRKSISEISE